MQFKRYHTFTIMNSERLRKIARLVLPDLVIVLDCRCLAYEFRGIAQFTYHLSRALSTVQHINLTLYCLCMQGSNLLPCARQQVIYLNEHNHERLNSIVRELKPTLFLVPSWFCRHCPVPEELIPITTPIIHDLIPYYLHRPSKLYLARLSLLSRIQHIYCVSNFTKGCLTNLKLDAEVIGVGTNSIPQPSPATIANVLRKFRIRGDFVFCHTAYDVHKGLEILISEFLLLRTHHSTSLQLVIGSKLPEQLAMSIPSGSGVIVTGVLLEAEKHSLYAAAWLVVTPSRMEGFGMPVADALMLSKPTIVANNSNLKELVADAKFQFTHARSSLSNLIHRLHTSKTLYQECVSYAKARKDTLLTWSGVVDNLLNYELRRLKVQKTISPS